MRYVGGVLLLLGAACMAWRLVADTAEMFGKSYDPPHLVDVGATIATIGVIGMLIVRLVRG